LITAAHSRKADDSVSRAVSRRSVCRPGFWFGLTLVGLVWGLQRAGGETNGPAKPERFISYTNAVDLEVPWSVHIVKADYSHPELRFTTVLGGGEVMGMDIVSEQIKTLPPEVGQPLAAINGDFYDKSRDFPIRPRDVQIRQGELLTQPTGHSSFWLDAQGQPHMTNVFSRFRVVWPNGKTSPINLNVPRGNEEAALYTAVVGKSTHTKGGVEYVLEPVEAGGWLPLRAGQTYRARIRSVHNTGDHPLDRETLVLSIGPGLDSSVPALHPGATLQIIMDTVPDLSGSDVAIGGGPALVKDGKVMEWKGWVHVRHPRTALGWNKKYLYLVQVDGRQLDVSVGMTFPELAEYMIKLGCDEAMNLDGGGSATLWAFGSVRNSPSEGQERPSPNAFVIVRKNQPQEAK
jgi:hypothetical protein